MYVISLTNLKGGSAKSTTAFNLAGALVEAGRKTLLIDLDPQRTLSGSFLGVDAGEPSLSDVLIKELNIEGAITDAGYQNLYCVPADDGLKTIKSGQLQIEGLELRLRSSLRELKASGGGRHGVEFVFIDCPPSLDRLTMNALVASDFVLIPVDPGAGGRLALSSTMEYARAARKWYNPVLRLMGLLVNNINVQTVYDKMTEDVIREAYGEAVFKTVIPSSVRIKEAAELRKPVVFCPAGDYGRYADSYRAFMAEVLERVGVQWQDAG